MVDMEDYKEALGGFHMRRFKREYCSVCHQQNDCDQESEIHACMNLDGYELALKMYDDVDCTREQFEEVMRELEKEEKLKAQARKVRMG